MSWSRALRRTIFACRCYFRARARMHASVPRIKIALLQCKPSAQCTFNVIQFDGCCETWFLLLPDEMGRTASRLDRERKWEKKEAESVRHNECQPWVFNCISILSLGVCACMGAWWCRQIIVQRHQNTISFSRARTEHISNATYGAWHAASNQILMISN